MCAQHASFLLIGDTYYKLGIGGLQYQRSVQLFIL